MEWIDGEDLRSLLDRVGRFSPDRILAIARQVGSALAAAHAKGVLHRDVKPANLLMDRQGCVRITDFGIARPADARGPEPLLGTPAYMAPELFAGLRATERSDLYSFALVLHELATGEPAVRADSDSALIDRQVHSAPEPLLEAVPGIDPRFDACLARALSKDPAARFPSVLAFVSALPGSDPLALAAEAGVTPSPELVASVGARQEGSARLATAIAIGIVLLLGVVFALADRGSHRRSANLRATPDFLAGRAAEIAAALGHATPPADEAWGFFPNMWTRGPGESVLFWYRRSPEPMANASLEFPGFVSPAGDFVARPGTVTILLDPAGKLVSLECTPGAEIAPAPAPRDAATILALAGLDPAELRPAAPSGPHSHPADTRLAFERPAAGGEPAMRIELDSDRGAVVAFSAVPQIAEPGGESVKSVWRRWYLRQYGFSKVFFFLLPLLAIPVAYFQLRCGRSDLRGAVRLFLAVFAVDALAAVLGLHHVRDVSAEIHVLQSAFAGALSYSARLALLYLALEPWVRRIWPESLVAWERALRGRFGDPSLGRSLSIGVLFGLAWSALRIGEGLAFESLRPEHAGRVEFTSLEHAMGAAAVVSHTLAAVSAAIHRGLLWLFAAVFCRWLLGRSPYALLPWVALLTFFAVAPRGGAAVSWALLGVGFAAAAAVQIRVGLLAVVTALAVSNLVKYFPVGFDVGGFWGGASVFAAVVILSLGLGGAALLARDPARRATRAAFTA